MVLGGGNVVGRGGVVYVQLWAWVFVGWMRLLWVGMLGFDFGGFGFGVWCLGVLLICLRISGV